MDGLIIALGALAIVGIGWLVDYIVITNVFESLAERWQRHKDKVATKHQP